MKKLKIKFLSLSILLLTLLLGSCTQDILQENPKSVFTPEYFKTELGVIGGLTSMYAHLRQIYGQPYYYNSTETGTDEYTWAQSADGNFKDSDLSGVGSITPQSAGSSVPWNESFYDINTASGVIENAAAVGLAPSLIGEAQFFRGFDYFLLVQTYGGVPLDLGAGELKFNTSTSRTSVRNTVPEVYTKAIFPDLLAAVNNLPVNPRLTGTATKSTARLYLSKAYLTYAWWLQNPNNISTYPAAPRTDPNGRDAAWYFQEAYNVAVAGIDNPGPYGLLNYFYDGYADKANMQQDFSNTKLDFVIDGQNMSSNSVMINDGVNSYARSGLINKEIFTRNQLLKYPISKEQFKNSFTIAVNFPFIIKPLLKKGYV